MGARRCDCGMYGHPARRHASVRRQWGSSHSAEPDVELFRATPADPILWPLHHGLRLPMAIGRKLAQPDRTVVSFSGDAGFLMAAGELATASEEGLAPIFVVFVDASLALIELKQRQRQLSNAAVDFARHDFAAMGRAFGGNGHSVTNRQELRAALTAAMAADTFTVIACEIDRGGYDGRI